MSAYIKTQVERLDKFVSVHLFHDGLARTDDLRSAAMDALVDAKIAVVPDTLRIRGYKGAVSYSWQVLDSAANVR